MTTSLRRLAAGGRRRRTYERASAPGAVQMSGRAQGQLPVWTTARAQQRQQRRSESASVPAAEGGARSPTDTGDDAFQDDDLMIEAVAVTDDDKGILFEDDVVYANAESMPSTIKLFLRDWHVRVCILISFVALIGIGVGVYMSVFKDRGASAQITGALSGPSPSPTPAPTVTMAPTMDLSPFKDILSQYSSLEDLERVGSPQHSAMLWLVNHDNIGFDFSVDDTIGRSTHLIVQRYVLAVLYYAMHECTDSWIFEDQWLDPNLHECNWGRAISCQPYAGGQFMVALDLSKTGLCGTLPPEIGFFEKLGSLLLDENDISGPIPEGLCNLSGLTVLQMGNNGLQGTLPDCMGQLRVLANLDLSNNDLQGSFPLSMYQLRFLRILDLSFNRFAGSISNELHQLTALTVANIASNLITGTIPDSFGRLGDLAFMYLDHNAISGEIPFFSGYLGRREEVSLSNNILTGTLPSELPNQQDSIGQSLNPADYRLQKVDFGSNLLSGSMPFLIGFLPSLVHLDISSNDITGTIPGSLGKFGLLKDLEHINFANNQLVGEIQSLGNPDKTKHLDLSNNKNLEGGFPSFILELKALEYLDIEGNSGYRGPLPSDIGSLTSLLHLNTQNCALNGHIPTTLGRLHHLVEMKIGLNSFSGTLPQEIGSISSLRDLCAEDNPLLGGSIPTTFGKLHNLKKLNLQSCALTGTIPQELSALDELEELYLNDNLFGGSVPEGVCTLQNKGDLDLIQIDCEIQCDCCSEEGTVCI